MTSDSAHAAIVRSPALASLSPISRETLAAEARRRRLDRGEWLWRDGEAPDALAVVSDGRLDIRRTADTGDGLLLRSLRPPSVVGWSLVAGVAATADVVAGEPSELFLIPGAVVRRVFSDEPTAALRALGELGTLVGRLTDELEALRFRDLESRLAERLRELSAGRREVRYTHQELGELVGGSRENVSRALKRFEERGAVRCHRGRLEILDLARALPIRR